MAKILIFGDSISWGAFDTEQGGWVERLKTFFLQHYDDDGFDLGVYNLSVSSNDTRGVLKFLSADIDKMNQIEPEEYILLFSVGSNDPRYIDQVDRVFVPEDEFEANLLKIVEIAKRHSTKIIFTGLMKVNESLTKPWIRNEFWENKDLENYDNIIKKVCEQNRIDFIPLFGLITEGDLADGLHPNSQGHAKIFTHIKKHLLKILNLSEKFKNKPLF
ncbi:MAG: GDSL-type esterase/lipase family protein [Candidatus Komeilibacteria bacterium]